MFTGKYNATRRGELFPVPGRYFDSETGFYDNYFRVYDPATGRYITSDPIGLNGELTLCVLLRWGK